MTKRLALFVSASLLAHLALLVAWHASPPPAMVTTHNLQVSLARSVRQVSAATATALPAPTAPSAQHPITAKRPPTAAHNNHPVRRRVKPIAAQPVTAPPVAVAIAAAIPATQSSDPGLSAATVTHVQSQLRLAFARYFKYPALARRRGWEGVVTLSLRLDPDGHLRAVHLIQSSGHAALDDAALISAQRMPPLREAITLLRGNPHEMLLPVEYRLVDG